jgi:tRNA threonylcarbamoyladenosine biosynthesis protein TsaB
VSRLLAIETSSEACSVALSLDGELQTREFIEPRRHAELLLPAVTDLISDAGMQLKELDAIAFGRGPGSFTSLRIGIGVVQGLAWGAELGEVPVSSLAALALGARRRFGMDQDVTVLTAMDARMGEVFCAQFDFDRRGALSLSGKERVADPSELESPTASRLIGAGCGFERYPALTRLSESFAAVYAHLWPSAENVVLLAEKWLERNEPLPAHRAQPIYIRDDVARKPV